MIYFNPIFIGPDNNLVSPTTDKAKRYDHIRGYNPCWLIMNNIAVGKPL